MTIFTDIEVYNQFIMNKSRLEAFSDGVLAIIITIMILEIKIPHEPSWAALCELWPTFLCYIISFIFIGIYWGNHHHLLHTVKNVSSGMIWANMHLLFWLSLIPFATGWMGENHLAPNTVCLYAILLFMCGISFTILQFTIQKTNKLSPELENAYSTVKKKGIISELCYAAAIPLAYVNTLISCALFITVSIMWIVPDRSIERALKNHQAD